MQQRTVVFALVMLFATAFGSALRADDWSLKGRFTDACSCNAACPCVFGSPPTQGFCEGNGLVEIEKGSYGDVSLDGVAAVVTYHMGAEGTWTKYYVSDKASDEQMKAMSQLLPAALGFLGGADVRAVEKAAVKVERSDGQVVFSVPASTTHLEKILSAEGAPITIENLPAKGFPGPPFLDYTLYRTVELKHAGGKGAFRHSGTSGHTTRIDVSGEI
jgi:hypothetical protein